jgi:lipopolysaccharide transport system ATP-binding protein
MSEPVIRVSGLGKKYRIRHQAERQHYVALRDVLADKTKSVARRVWSAVASSESEMRSSKSVEDFWALKDVSFGVKEGEVLGVIGPNGAGKSTLLKILSRITEPTTGRVELNGRVASLLEVGTGFHSELTGRENIFLNGSILGMTKAEIAGKFDEIVAFADVEKFLDTPVKRYSSGMYVRLAFAVAAHLEPEILVVDEVLAVGDVEFQTKCLGKIEAVSQGGRTVLFVSHNMGTVQKLCSRVLLLKAGEVVEQGEPAAVIARYVRDSACRGSENKPLNIRAPGHPFTLRAVEVLNAEGNPASLLPNHQPFRVRLTYALSAAMPRVRVGFRLHAQDTTVVLSTTDCDMYAGKIPARPAGDYISEVEFPAQLLNRGGYYLWIGVDIPMVCPVLSVDQAASFSIEPVRGIIAEINDDRLGVVAPLLKWTFRRASG